MRANPALVPGSVSGLPHAKLRSVNLWTRATSKDCVTAAVFEKRDLNLPSKCLHFKGLSTNQNTEQGTAIIGV